MARARRRDASASTCSRMQNRATSAPPFAPHRANSAPIEQLHARVGRFYFYEMYTDADAAALHKTLPHYLAWADFKKDARNPVISQSVVKMTSAFDESK